MFIFIFLLKIFQDHPQRNGCPVRQNSSRSDPTSETTIVECKDYILTTHQVT